MTDNKARAQLRKLDEQRKTYHNSRRDKNERHENFAKTMNELKEVAVDEKG